MVVAAGGLQLPRRLRRPAGAQIDQLYRRYAEEVFRYSVAVLRSRADAEDVVQTVFVRALRALERGERVAKPHNWLIKIAHNECRRLLASRRVHAELPEELAAEPAERGRAEELRGALDALPAQQRQALVLRELKGRSYAEIAARLDLSVSAVETLLFRARRSLREQLDAALGCDEFAVLLDDPHADRARLRAHARVCESCAHLERQARGRKSRLGRIASSLFPWWGTGAKVAAVALGTATFAGGVGGGIAIADEPHAHHSSPVAGAAEAVPATAGKHTRRAPLVKVSHTVAVSTAAKATPAPVLRLQRRTAGHVATQPFAAPAPTPAPATTAPAHAPSLATTPPAVTAPPEAPQVATPAVTVTTPVAVVTAPAESVSVPAVTVTSPEVVVSPVTTPVVTTPAVSVPSVTIPPPSPVNVSGP